MTVVLLLALCVAVTVVLGLPLLLKPDSPIPDILGVGGWAGLILYCIWTQALWWVLLPILALVALEFWLDSKAAAAAPPPVVDGRGMSARTRLRFRLGCASQLVLPAMIAALFILPAGSLRHVILPVLLIAMSAMMLFQFSFYRSWRRDALAQDGVDPGPASPAGFG